VIGEPQAARHGGRVLLGMLTPSSNTILEPVTTAMLQNLPEVSAHFARFRVQAIGLDAALLDQFDDRPMLAAAELLADAEVDAIAWNGTSAGWLGFERDQRLCERITAATGIPATSSVLAANELLARDGIAGFGLVTPYTADVQARIVANYGRTKHRIVAERHLGISRNFDFSEVGSSTLARMVREVAGHTGTEAVMTLCTNLRSAPLVPDLEREIGRVIYDSVSVVVWKSLVLAGANPRRVKGWGRLFEA
jgi:maleate isomerase